MALALTLEKFDSLSRRDFDNGAIIDEIREALKDLESLCHFRNEVESKLLAIGFDGPKWSVPTLKLLDALCTRFTGLKSDHLALRIMFAKVVEAAEMVWIQAEYDCPGDTPELCGWSCSECKGEGATEETIDHAADCFVPKALGMKCIAETAAMLSRLHEPEQAGVSK